MRAIAIVVMLTFILQRHPAHVHIDLLPHARGKGHGRALMRLQLGQLARRGAVGVHLNMAAR
jgi:hypothetical protein